MTQQIIGTNGNEIIQGTTRDERVFGLGGADTIFGSDGNDQITGDHSYYIAYNFLNKRQSYLTFSVSADAFDPAAGIYPEFGLYLDNKLVATRTVKALRQLGQREDLSFNLTELGISGDVSTLQLRLLNDRYQVTSTGAKDNNLFFRDIRINDFALDAGATGWLRRDGSVWATGSYFINFAIPKGLLNVASGGNDILYGGAGDDDLFGDLGNDKLYGGDGNDHLNGGIGDDEIYGGDGNDFIEEYPDGGNDIFYGGAGNDYLNSEGSNRVLYGNEGNDWILSNVGNSFLDGGAGNDTIWSYGGISTLIGGYGDDILSGNADSFFDGGDGNDQINVSKNEYAFEKLPDVLGGPGNDKIHIDASLYYSIRIFGGSGDDEIYGSDINTPSNPSQYFYGEDGNDYIVGDRFTSMEFGKSDIIYGGAGNDIIFGGRDDWGDISKFKANIYAIDNSENLYEINILYGEDGDDLLTSGISDDYLDGGSGNDTLICSGARNTLIGGHDEGQAIVSGNTLTILKQGDTLTGGYEQDIFAYTQGDGFDVITDFEDNVDRLQLTAQTGAWALVDVLNGTFVDFGAGEGIFLQNMTSAQLQDDLVTVSVIS